MEDQPCDSEGSGHRQGGDQDPAGSEERSAEGHEDQDEAAGQVQGVERMLEEGRECRDVMAQISAVTKALEQAEFRLVASGLTYCIEHPEDAEDDGCPIDAVQKMFMKLA